MKVCPVCGSEFGDEAAFCSRDRSPLRPADGENAPGLVGQLVGDRYQVEQRIAEGGMGEVYLARHVLMGRSCALKVMSPAVSRDPDAVTRFNREATNASRISHPNVCAVYDFGLTPDGLVYLAMEYVAGRTLTAVMEEAGAMPLPRALHLLAQCAAGLQAAHDLGIIHRDLKPDNIMVTGSGERETAKLVDFGIAKVVVAEPDQQVTKSGFVVGTPDYMSPEQLAGDPLDPRSDQYSLALVFYRLITGRLPFEGATAQETLVKRLTDPPRPLLSALPGARFPAGLQGVMDRALARQPRERYPSVTAFAAALQQVAESDEAPTRRLSAPQVRGGREIPPTRKARTSPSRKGARVVAAAATVVIVGGGTWGLMQLRRMAAETPVAPSPAPSSAAARDTSRVAAGAEPAGVVPPSTTPGPEPVRKSAPRDKPGGSRGAGPVAGDSLAMPTLEQFDSPRTRDWAVSQATRILAARTEPDSKRAEAAKRLGATALSRHDRAAALGYFQWANRLHPDSTSAIMIQQLSRDTTGT